MPSELDRLMQGVLAAPERQARCRRAACRRHRHCVPPRQGKREPLFRCPFEDGDAWRERAVAAAVIVRRLMQVAEASHAARGLPSPFRPTTRPDPLDLATPLDVADLLAHPVDPELGLSRDGRGRVRAQRGAG